MYYSLFNFACSSTYTEIVYVNDVIQFYGRIPDKCQSDWQMNLSSRDGSW